MIRRSCLDVKSGYLLVKGGENISKNPIRPVGAKGVLEIFVFFITSGTKM